jgi:hypothetical protein
MCPLCRRTSMYCDTRTHKGGSAHLHSHNHAQNPFCVRCPCGLALPIGGSAGALDVLHSSLASTLELHRQHCTCAESGLRPRSALEADGRLQFRVAVAMVPAEGDSNSMVAGSCAGTAGCQRARGQREITSLISECTTCNYAHALIMPL